MLRRLLALSVPVRRKRATIPVAVNAPTTMDRSPPAAVRRARHREWSGQSGGSGHPLMTAEAIRAAAANFPLSRGAVAGGGAPRRVARELSTPTAGLTPDLRIMDLMDAQPEFTQAFWDYLDLLVSDARIQRGREILAQHARPSLRRRRPMASIATSSPRSGASNRTTERRSASGRCCARPRRSPASDAGRTISATSSSRRSKFSIAATCARPADGSWAGAFGPTQFMPTSFKRYAVDFDGDGRRDVVDSIPDVIASTANNLKKDGWVAGQTWGYEVVLPQGFDFLLADRSRPMTMCEWERAGIAPARRQAVPASGRSRLSC